MVAPVRTSHPSGSRPSHFARPLAALAAPENPLFPTASNPDDSRLHATRTDLWLHPRLASGVIQPLVAHSTGATNSTTLLASAHWAGAASGAQSGLMVVPTPTR